MATRIPVPLLTEDITYSRFKIELDVWAKTTDLAKTKQAAVIALSLPKKTEKFKIDIKEKVFEEIGDKLNAEDGMKTLIDFLDKHLEKDKLADFYDKHVTFERYSREEGQSMEAYIAQFDTLYQKLKKLNVTIAPEILACKLIYNANLSPEKQMFVKSDIDYEKKDTMYTSAQTALKKYYVCVYLFI